MVGEVLEQVELGHDAAGPPAPDREERRGAVGQQRERLVERSRRRRRRQRPVHDLADGPLDDRRVAVRPLEQALLADRADDPLERVALGCSDTGSWLMP